MMDGHIDRLARRNSDLDRTQFALLAVKQCKRNGKPNQIMFQTFETNLNSLKWATD